MPTHKPPTSYTDPYHTLGLDRSATSEDIKRAYFTLVREHPPERDPANFKRIRAAYEKLRDPSKRVETNMLSLNRWPMPNPSSRSVKFEGGVHTEDILAVARTLTDIERTDWQHEYKDICL
jgi:curved DNA-binding protein CbpA